MQQSGTLVQHFDVAILGSGISGGLMGCILARQGLKVVIIDTGTHPRLALDESSIDETTYMLRILAERYDVPEIEHCSSLGDDWQHVTSACSIKRNFGFVFHKDKIQNPNQVTQCNVSEFPFGAQMHYYRQDIDAYLFHSAIKYGAVAKQHTQVETVRLHSQGVTIATDTGEEFEVAYVVDGSDRNSVLARQFSSNQTVGDRWCLMNHAVGTVDALFSRGMSSITQVVNAAAALILQAFKDGNFSAQRFEYLDRLNQTHLLNLDIERSLSSWVVCFVPRLRSLASLV